MAHSFSNRILRSIAIVLVAPLTTWAVVNGVWAQSPEPGEGADSSAPLDCSAGDSVTGVTSTYAANAEGAPGTPDASLQVYLDDQGTKITAADFKPASATDDSVLYELNESGETQATAFTEQIGDGWGVINFSACSSYLAEQSTSDSTSSGKAAR
jgi:hypothetical protein